MRDQTPAPRSCPQPSKAAAVLATLTCALMLSSACKEKVVTALSEQTAAPDRLKPNESLPATQTAFGIPIPPSLQVNGRFATAVYMQGRAKAEDLTEYFRLHVLTDHLELLKDQTIFPRVYVKGDASKRLYRIEITAQRTDYSHVTIRDITPPPPAPKLTEEERWARVGMNPDGTLKDRLKLK